MGDVLYNFVLQVVFTIGIIVLFGFLIALCNRTFYRNMNRLGLPLCYITGFIGTPVHELAHALMCVIFGHKIVDMKLFQIGDEDGTLGYVSHSYNPKNWYHQIGNFFIGVAPIIVISAVLYLLADWLVPGMTGKMFALVESIERHPDFGTVLTKLFDIVVLFFSYAGEQNWWIFLLIGLFMSLHMTLSGADIKNATKGLIFLLLIMLAANMVIWFIGADLSDLTSACLSFGILLGGIMVMGLIMSVVAVIISALYKAVFDK